MILFQPSSINLSLISGQVKEHDRMVIFLDLDGTLKSAENGKGSLSFSTGEKTYVFDARPGIQSFIHKLGKIAPVYLYTASLDKYANTCLRVMGLTGIESVLTRRNMDVGGFPKCDSFVLIDDDAVLADVKIFCLNRLSRGGFSKGRNCWYVAIPSYHNGEEDPSVLEKVLSEVRVIVTD